MIKFYIIYVLFTFFSNFTNAIMPLLFERINLSSNIYGISFALMSLFTFLTSLYFSKLLEKYPINYLMGGSLLIFAMGQYLLKITVGIPLLFISRILAGIGAGGLMVSSLTYLLNYAKNVTKSLSIYAIIQTLGLSAGFFIGSIFGQYSLDYNFVIQIIGCVITSILIIFLLPNLISKQTKQSHHLDKTPLLKWLLLSVFLSSLGYFMHDNWLNYYFKHQLMFEPLSIGYFRLAIGMMSLFINVILIFFVENAHRLLFYILLASTLLLGLSMIFTSLTSFLIVTLLYSMLTVIFFPLQQRLMKEVTNNNSNSSLFNATRAIGMSIGPFIAGFAYQFSSIYPLMLSIFSFLLSTISIYCFFFLKKDNIKNSNML